LICHIPSHLASFNYNKRELKRGEAPLIQPTPLSFEGEGDKGGEVSMIPTDIDQITEEDLQALIDNSVIEGKTIEYKQSLPSNSDSDKKEFLADVSSFANASGGDLIYGIIEDE